MPLPVAHSLAGCLFHESPGFAFFKKGWKNLAFLVAVSNLPDIDFLPGFLVGAPNRYHHGVSHTLGAAVLAGAAAAWFFRKRGKSAFTSFWTVSLVYFAHVLLDYFTEDFRPPFGVMLFWPFHSAYLLSPATIFPRVVRSGSSSDFFQSLFNMNNLEAVLVELLVMGTLYLAVRLVFSAKNRPRRGFES